MLTWSHQQGEDVSDASFVLRAVQGCFKKRLPKYKNNLSSSLETLGELPYLLSRKSHLRPDSRRVQKSNLPGVFFMSTRKNVTVVFCLFFSAVILVQSAGENNNKNVKTCHLKQKKRANVTFFRMVMKTNPAKCLFPTLLQSGRKSLKPKCSGSCWNPLVHYTIVYFIRRSIRGSILRSIRGTSRGAAMDTSLSETRRRLVEHTEQNTDWFAITVALQSDLSFFQNFEHKQRRHATHTTYVPAGDFLREQGDRTY